MYVKNYVYLKSGHLLLSLFYSSFKPLRSLSWIIPKVSSVSDLPASTVAPIGYFLHRWASYLFQRKIRVKAKVLSVPYKHLHDVPITSPNLFPTLSNALRPVAIPLTCPPGTFFLRTFSHFVPSA